MTSGIPDSRGVPMACAKDTLTAIYNDIDSVEKLFAENPGKVFTKKQIYRAVWNEEYAFDDNNIMVHIRRLRKKIEDNPENPNYILTVWGVGYKLSGEIK